MNYRRGYLRLYAVLVVFWGAFVLFATQSGRWKPWPYMPRAQWEVEAESTIVTSNPPRSSDKSDEPKWTVSPEQFLRDAALQGERHRRIVSWSWVIGLVLVPPALGYFVLFHVSRWIYRGFKPATQI